MRIRIATAISLLALVAAGCKHGGSAATPTPTAASSQPAEEGTTAYQGSTAATGGGESASAQASAPTPNPSPLQLDEGQLKKWMAYHRELVTFINGEQKKLAAVEGKGDAQTIVTAGKISEEIDKGSADLLKKYGLTKDRDEEITQAVNDVVGNMTMENPQMADAFASVKQQAAAAGAEGEAARAQLKQMQDDEKKNLDDARLKWGPAAVALLIAHQPELSKQQADAMAAAFGDGK